MPLVLQHFLFKYRIFCYNPRACPLTFKYKMRGQDERERPTKTVSLYFLIDPDKEVMLKERGLRSILFATLPLFPLLFLFNSPGLADQTTPQTPLPGLIAEEVIPVLSPEEIKVELILARNRKKDAKKIKKILRDASIKRIMIQYFQRGGGDPPKNIVIGKHVPADIARLAIDLAFTYNKGITHLLPEFRFFAHYIAIGNSAFDIQAQIPVLPEDVERLRNPALSTEEFHALFRSLTGEDEEGTAGGYVD